MTHGLYFAIPRMVCKRGRELVYFLLGALAKVLLVAILFVFMTAPSGETVITVVVILFGWLVPNGPTHWAFLTFL